MKLKVGKYVNDEGKVIIITKVSSCNYGDKVWYTFPETNTIFISYGVAVAIYLERGNFKFTGLK